MPIIDLFYVNNRMLDVILLILLNVYMISFYRSTILLRFEKISTPISFRPPPLPLGTQVKYLYCPISTKVKATSEIWSVHRIWFEKYFLQKSCRNEAETSSRPVFGNSFI